MRDYMISEYTWGGNSDWQAKKENFKARFPILTDTDLLFENVDTESMFIKLKTKLGVSSDELNTIMLTL